jgi:hypothetical protein
MYLQVTIRYQILHVVGDKVGERDSGRIPKLDISWDFPGRSDESGIDAQTRIHFFPVRCCLGGWIKIKLIKDAGKSRVFSLLFSE